MEEVGSHLYAHAKSLLPTQEREADLFGRSAFNRYYYAAYLATKRDLSEVLNDLPRGHKNTWDYIRGLSSGRIKEIKRRARRTHDHTLEQQCSDAQRAAEHLARLLETASAIREAADYHPEIPVKFTEDKTFSLNEFDVETAKSWPFKARRLTRDLVAVLRQA